MSRSFELWPDNYFSECNVTITDEMLPYVVIKLNYPSNLTFHNKVRDRVRVRVRSML